MTDATYFERIANVPTGRELDRWQRRTAWAKRLVVMAYVAAGLVSVTTPAFRDWAAAHPIELALLTGVMCLVTYSRWRLTVLRFSGSLPEDELQPPLRDELRASFERLRGDRRAVLRIRKGDGNAGLLGNVVVLDWILLRLLTREQIEAVLAHELAHWPARRRLGIALAVVCSSVATAVALLRSSSPSPSPLLVGLSASLLAFSFALARFVPSLTAPGSRRVSRAEAKRWAEHHADWVAARHAGGWAMIGALLKTTELGSAQVDVYTAMLERGIARGSLPTSLLDVLRHEDLRDDRRRRTLIADALRKAPSARHEASAAQKAQWREQLARLAGAQSPNTFVSWRDFDTNHDGEIQAHELRALLQRIGPWPSLALERMPVTALSTHPAALERVLFVLRECGWRTSAGIAQPTRDASHQGRVARSAPPITTK